MSFSRVRSNSPSYSMSSIISSIVVRKPLRSKNCWAYEFFTATESKTLFAPLFFASFRRKYRAAMRLLSRVRHKARARTPCRQSRRLDHRSPPTTPSRYPPPCGYRNNARHRLGLSIEKTEPGRNRYAAQQAPPQTPRSCRHRLSLLAGLRQT